MQIGLGMTTKGKYDIDTKIPTAIKLAPKCPNNTIAAFDAGFCEAIIYTGSFDALSNIAVSTIWLFFILGIGGVFALRTKHKELITRTHTKCLSIQ